MNWQTKIKVIEGSPNEVYRAMMETVWRVSKVSKVPNYASWRCFKRGNYHFFLADWKPRFS